MDIRSLVANVLKIYKYLICAYYTRNVILIYMTFFNWNIMRFDNDI